MKENTSAEHLYDTFSPLIYSIALQISPSPKLAEEVLCNSFKKFYNWMASKAYTGFVFPSIIRLTVDTAKDLFHVDTNLRLRQFELTPMLYKLVCQDCTFQEYLESSKLSKEEGLQRIQKEVAFIKQSNMVARD